jgi:nitrogen fixation protein NifZ
MNAPDEPKFRWGQRVSSLTDLYNDGSFPNAAVDALLVVAGVPGEIVQLGVHVESKTNVYMVEFPAGIVVGCLEDEIVAWEPERASAHLAMESS